MSIAARLNAVIGGKYRIERFIGAGGMGLLYEARHRLTEERVALKFLREERASEDEWKRRFVQEAQIAAKLRHPNATCLMDLDIDPQFGLYMVLQLLHGVTLEEHLRQVKTLSFELAHDWLIPIMQVLGHAHELGVLHRDVTPANIFLHRDAHGAVMPKLLDFGLVRVMDEAGLGTKTGQAMGTPGYASPEQSRGEKGLTPATDVWSMAVVWYRCLSGCEPFERSSVEASVHAALRGEYEPLDRRCPQLPQAKPLQRILSSALRAPVQERTESMAAFAAQLTALAQSQGHRPAPIETLPPSAAEPRRADSARLVWAMLALLLLTLLVLAALGPR